MVFKRQKGIWNRLESCLAVRSLKRTKGKDQVMTMWPVDEIPSNKLLSCRPRSLAKSSLTKSVHSVPDADSAWQKTKFVSFLAVHSLVQSSWWNRTELIMKSGLSASRSLSSLILSLDISRFDTKWKCHKIDKERKSFIKIKLRYNLANSRYGSIINYVAGLNAS